MGRWFLMIFFAAAHGRAEPLPEWQPYAKSGLFPAESPLWLAPDMEKEPMSAYTARLLDAARNEDAKAMATLGRFFFVRGDAARAGEWLGKAARAGHAGAQLDFGVLRLRGVGGAANALEAYAWIWLATRGGAPGAEQTLRQISAQFSMGQVIAGVKLAGALQSSAR